MLTAEHPHVNRETLSGKWPLRLAYFVLFLMLTFPQARLLAYGKMALIAVLFVFVLIQAITRVHLHRDVVLWTVGMAMVSLFFSLRGLCLNAPGAFACLRTYAIWPLIYLALLSGIRSTAILQGFKKTMVFSTIFTGFFGMYLFLSHLHVVPNVPFESLLTSEEAESGLLLSISFENGHVVMQIPGENSLPFLVPFLFAVAVNGGFSSKEKRSAKVWLFIALFLGLVVVVLSGRRGLQLVTMLAPFLALALGLLQPRKERQVLARSVARATLSLSAVLVLAFLLLGPLYAITFEGLTERFREGFDFSASNRTGTANDRIVQYFPLLEGWTRSPLLGNGLGAVATHAVRSDIGVPWSQELFYLNLLFQTGLVGLLAYTAGIGWICWMGMRVLRRNGEAARLMLPLLVGMLSLLIANGTNPYLARFDGIWAIFLPLALINHWLIEHDRRQVLVSEKP